MLFKTAPTEMNVPLCGSETINKGRQLGDRSEVFVSASQLIDIAPQIICEP
jgi:hypothetical protein